MRGKAGAPGGGVLGPPLPAPPPLTPLHASLPLLSKMVARQSAVRMFSTLARSQAAGEASALMGGGRGLLASVSAGCLWASGLPALIGPASAHPLSPPILAPSHPRRARPLQAANTKGLSCHCGRVACMGNHGSQQARGLHAHPNPPSDPNQALEYLRQGNQVR